VCYTELEGNRLLSHSIVMKEGLADGIGRELSCTVMAESCLIEALADGPASKVGCIAM